MGIPAEAQRESIWSVPSSWVTAYLVLFSVQVTACAGFVAWLEITQHTMDTWPETILAIGRGAGSFVIVIAAGTIMQVEATVLVSTWILEKYKARRFAQGRAVGRDEGRDEGRNEGRDEGRNEGRNEERKKWATWYQRSQAAEAAGEKFDEPPPLDPDVL